MPAKIAITATVKKIARVKLENKNVICLEVETNNSNNGQSNLKAVYSSNLISV